MEGLVQYRFEMKANVNAPEYKYVTLRPVVQDCN